MEPSHPNGPALDETDRFDHDGAVHAPHVEWKDLYQKSIGKRREPPPRVHQLPPMMTFCTYEDELKSSASWSATSSGGLIAFWLFTWALSDSLLLWIWKVSAPVVNVRLGLNPLSTSLCVMSRSDNLLASSSQFPSFKQVFERKMSDVATICSFDLKTRNSLLLWPASKNLPTDPALVHYSRKLGQAHLYRSSSHECLYPGQHKSSKSFQELAAPDDIYPYSINEGFIDLTSLQLLYSRSSARPTLQATLLLLGSESAFGSKLGTVLLSGE